MCLAVPGKVIEIDRTADPVMATAEFGGVRQRVCVAWVPEAKVGDYVIVHVGFAISVLDEEAAMKTLELLALPPSSLSPPSPSPLPPAGGED